MQQERDVGEQAEQRHAFDEHRAVADLRARIGRRPGGSWRARSERSSRRGLALLCPAQAENRADHRRKPCMRPRPRTRRASRSGRRGCRRRWRRRACRRCCRSAAAQSPPAGTASARGRRSAPPRPGRRRRPQHQPRCARRRSTEKFGANAPINALRPRIATQTVITRVLPTRSASGPRIGCSQRPRQREGGAEHRGELHVDRQIGGDLRHDRVGHAHEQRRREADAGDHEQETGHEPLSDDGVRQEPRRILGDRV